MSIERDGGEIIVSCDSCTEYLATDTNDFRTALALLEDEDWTVRRMASEWVHTCPICQEKETGNALALS